MAETAPEGMTKWYKESTVPSRKVLAYPRDDLFSPQPHYHLNQTQPFHIKMFRSIISILTLASLAISTRVPGACYEDNCKRAVQRTWQGMDVYSQHLRDCATNLACASTPAAFTSTVTQSVTAGTITITVPKATATPNPVDAVLSCGNKVPDYLTAQCENQFVSYSSACSCAQATGTTSVAPTPTITATVTSTIPASIVYV
jgi:hypothetical protein